MTHKDKQVRRRKKIMRRVFAAMDEVRATVTAYGSCCKIEYLGCAIHQGSTLLAHRIFAPTDEELDWVLEEAIREFGVERVCLTDGVLEPEFCECCGEPTARMADVLAERECEAFGVPCGSTFSDVQRCVAEWN